MDRPGIQSQTVPMKDKAPWDLYGDYLCLDKILDAQHPWSTKAGHPVHDEMLFIVFHQTYELWFRQILFELDDVQERLAGEALNDRDLLPVLKHLDRIASIWRLLVKQIDILETMTAQDFTDFREYLRSASGFQSLQFRLIETRLGLRREDRAPVFHGHFDDNLLDEHKLAIKRAESRPSLFTQIENWLARTPFIDRNGYHFHESYRTAVHEILDEKVRQAQKNLSGQPLENELEAIKRGRYKFDGIFDPAEHAKTRKEGLWRLSWKALQAALFITAYRNEPALQIPSRFLALVMDIDEQLALWRYRHALMTQRMVGMSVGTGGSAGYGYLIQTLEKHRIFTDLFALSSYLIPTRAIPPLPESVSAEMGYRYAGAGKG